MSTINVTRRIPIIKISHPRHEIVVKRRTTTINLHDGGRRGLPGVGIPEGGTDNQFLIKSSNADYDTEWADNTAVRVYYDNTYANSVTDDFFAGVVEQQGFDDKIIDAFLGVQSAILYLQTHTVASVTAGTNVTITGTAQNPIINASGGGGGSPGGSDQQIQYNSSGSFAGANIITDGNNLALQTPSGAYIFPDELGSNHNISADSVDGLLFDGSPVSGGSGSPAGSDTQIQFNDGGSFGADSDFTFDKSTSSLKVAGGTGAGVNLEVNGSTDMLYLNMQGSQVLDNNKNASLKSATVSDATASTIAHFDGSKSLKSLAIATYPDLTELSYVKGVTSSVQTQLDNLSLYFNVLDYGATGNGSTDDTTAIQATLDAAGSAKGTAYFPSGSYKITSSLTVGYSGLSLLGESIGSIITFNGSSVSPALKMIDTTQRTNINISSLQFKSTSTGSGLAIDMSYFAVSTTSNVYISSSNAGISIDSANAFYNHIKDCRIVVSGSGSYGVKISSLANENTLSRLRISTDSNSTGVIVNAQSCSLYDVNVETGALIGIDVQSAGNYTQIYAPYLEANATNLKLASGITGIGIFGGTIISATTANITDDGVVAAGLHNVNVAFTNLNQLIGTGVSSQLNLKNGTSSQAALMLDMAQPTSGVASTRDSHQVVMRGTSWDGSSTGHSIDWQNYINVTGSTTSQMLWRNKLDSGGYSTRLTLGGDGRLTTGGRLTVGGGVQVALSTKTANYTITTSDSVVLGDSSAGNITLTLPTAVNFAGLMYNIKKIDSNTHDVIIATTSGQTIDGSSTLTMSIQNQSYTLVSDSANWRVI